MSAAPKSKLENNREAGSVSASRQVDSRQADTPRLGMSESYQRRDHDKVVSVLFLLLVIAVEVDSGRLALVSASRGLGAGWSLIHLALERS